MSYLPHYRLTSITRGRAIVTYAGQPIGVVTEELHTGYWRAFLGPQRLPVAGLHPTRRAARDALVQRHARTRARPQPSPERARGAR